MLLESIGGMVSAVMVAPCVQCALRIYCLNYEFPLQGSSFFFATKKLLEDEMGTEEQWNSTLLIVHARTYGCDILKTAVPLFFCSSVPACQRATYF